MQQLPSRKRGREKEFGQLDLGFAEHRAKRRDAAIAHQTNLSPHNLLTPTPQDAIQTNSLATFANASCYSACRNSESHALSKNAGKKGSSPPQSLSLTQSDSNFAITAPQMCSQPDLSSCTVDMEMNDSECIPSSPICHNLPLKTSGRIPTPIHSSFTSFVKSEGTFNKIDNQRSLAKHNSLSGGSFRNRKLPSPISEGTVSPSLMDGSSDMQFGVEGLLSPKPKDEKERFAAVGQNEFNKNSESCNMGGKGENRNTSGIKKTFTLGYRADCEKCRLKIPGHFSHIFYH